MYLDFLKVVVLLSLLFVKGLSRQNSTSAGNVTIGSIFTKTSLNGQVADIAMRAAVDDVNSDPRILGDRTLVLSTSDSNFSGFRGIIGGLRHMATDIVAIIGPQTSEMAHILSHLANELHVPLLSFTALDPTLASLQYPYLIQTAPNDLYQMTAIADMINYFGYKEVAVIYTDDEQSRGSMVALGDRLAERLCRITYKAVLPPELNATIENITEVLVQISRRESRVVVVHAFESVGRMVLKMANSLKMVQNGYVWIATAWLSTVLDSRPSSATPSEVFEGVLTLRPHTPDSAMKTAFFSRWKNLSHGSIGLNPYGLYAYDTVMIIAHAVGEVLRSGGNISFTHNPILSSMRGSLSTLRTFDAGEQLLDNIKNTSMTGLTGQIAFQPDKSMIHPAFDILNVNGAAGYKQIGYWSNYSGLSIVPPEELYDKPANRSSANQQLRSVMWPGNTKVQPRGWVFPNNGRPLRIGIPKRVSYELFVSMDEDTKEISGYCIDVFLAAIKLLPYTAHHVFIPFGDGLKDPNYTQLIDSITTGAIDAAVGDIAIVTKRTKRVDFTQPYIESGLLVVVPIRNQGSGAWAFLQPFTGPMWAVTGAFFVMVGIVIWILEHRINDEFRGPPRQQLITLLWFGFSTMFFAHRENTMSTLGRMILLIWLFVVLIITSSYTASYTSILTLQQIPPSIRGIESLINTDDPIGVQRGSFVRDYLNDELHIPKSRLISLETPEECEDALTSGRVSAIVDERPYMDLFLSNYCKFQAVGQEFTKSGWGFAFPRDSPLAIDMSSAILQLSENGELKRIGDKWLKTQDCSRGNTEGQDELQLISFSGLFLMSGTAGFLALIIYLCKVIVKYNRNNGQATESTTPRNGAARTTPIQRFLSFFDHKEEDLDSRSKRKHSEVIP
ncbi:glutamate receptor 3.2-like [Henckelia pumila]|uniref:glutamate receptor 3.2-like n=1 Tax=Henckelia pumila TaxID=405737 RepID=UPI003C6DD215